MTDPCRPSGGPTEKRRHTRITFPTPAVLTCAGSHWTTEVADLSFKGALLRSPSDWHGAPGDQCTLRIPLDSGDGAEIRMATTVIHVGRGRIGVRCDEIDIDSVTHLRRLIELNLADEDLLAREVGKLAAD